MGTGNRPILAVHCLSQSVGTAGQELGVRVAEVRREAGTLEDASTAITASAIGTWLDSDNSVTAQPGADSIRR